MARNKTSNAPIRPVRALSPLFTYTLEKTTRSSVARSLSLRITDRRCLEWEMIVGQNAFSTRDHTIKTDDIKRLLF